MKKFVKQPINIVLEVDVNGKDIEEFGFKAAEKGFFREWQKTVSELSKKDAMAIDKAVRIAYDQLAKEIISDGNTNPFEI